MSVLAPRAPASRTRLLDAAEAELVERDGALEVASVAERAQVSVGLLYPHFGSKAGLLAAVVERFYARLDEEVMSRDPAPDADWATRERVRTELAVGFHYDDPLAAVVLSRLGREPLVAAVEAELVGREVAAAAANIARGQERGELPIELDPGLVGAMILGGIRQVLVEALGRPQPPPRGAVVDQLWGFIARAVGWTGAR